MLKGELTFKLSIIFKNPIIHKDNWKKMGDETAV